MDENSLIGKIPIKSEEEMKQLQVEILLTKANIPYKIINNDIIEIPTMGDACKAFWIIQEKYPNYITSVRLKKE